MKQIFLFFKDGLTAIREIHSNNFFDVSLALRNYIERKIELYYLNRNLIKFFKYIQNENRFNCWSKT